MGIEQLLIETNTLAAHDVDGGWRLALERLCALVKADAGFVVLAGRTSDRTDYLFGWRSLLLLYFNRTPKHEAIGHAWANAPAPSMSDPATRAHCARAGTLRASRAADLVPEHLWFDSPSLQLMEQLDTQDRIITAHPLTDDLEVYFGLDRAKGQPNFTPDDVQTALKGVQALGRLCRWLALSFGAMPQMKLLTVREREVLALLLTGAPEKQFASALGLTPAYTHQVVVRVYRKLAVTSRAELMSLWLAAYTP